MAANPAAKPIARRRLVIFAPKVFSVRSLPFGQAMIAQRRIQLARFTLPWRGRVDCRAKRRQAGWGGLALRKAKFTPPRLTSRYARCFADPPPPGEGEASASILRAINRALRI